MLGKSIVHVTKRTPLSEPETGLKACGKSGSRTDAAGRCPASWPIESLAPDSRKDVIKASTPSDIA